MRFFAALLLFLTLGVPAAAQDAEETPLVTLKTGDALRGWEGVGRLDIRGKGFCTAALIRESLILTAAHCVYDSRGRLIDRENFVFNAGLRYGRAEATRGIRSLVAHPDYQHEGDLARDEEVAVDIAVLQLDAPIRRSRVQPFRIAARPRAGDQVGVVSYGRGRSETPSLQEVCSVRGLQRGVVVMNCDVDYGSSGSPVFMVRDGQPMIVSVVSAMARMAGDKISLGTSLQEPLQQLLAHYSTIGPARPGGTQRILTLGERNETGAKFTRP